MSFSLTPCWKDINKHNQNHLHMNNWDQEHLHCWSQMLHQIKEAHQQYFGHTGERNINNNISSASMTTQENGSINFSPRSRRLHWEVKLQEGSPVPKWPQDQCHRDRLRYNENRRLPRRHRPHQELQPYQQQVNWSSSWEARHQQEQDCPREENNRQAKDEVIHCFEECAKILGMSPQCTKPFRPLRNHS